MNVQRPTKIAVQTSVHVCVCVYVCRRNSEVLYIIYIQLILSLLIDHIIITTVYCLSHCKFNMMYMVMH